MNLINIYTLAIGSKASFLNRFSNSEELYAQAQVFWSKLDSNAYIFALLFLIMGVALAWYYYVPFNKQPGRHYHPKYWLIIMVCCFVATFLFTLLAAYLSAKPNLTGTWPLELKLSLVNGLYSLGIYLIVSLVYCNGLSTNAYRLLKF